MSKLYHILLENGSFLEKTILFFSGLCILTGMIYEKFIKRRLYEGKNMGYNKTSCESSGEEGPECAVSGALKEPREKLPGEI